MTEGNAKSKLDCGADARPKPFAFGPPERRLFGWYHPPTTLEQRTESLILCKPIGYEAMCTHATYRYIAEQFADAGFPVLRFDYDGTGDSFGSDEEPDRLEAWMASIDCAISTIRDLTGNVDVALFGMRLGATLALMAAEKRQDIKRLILWATCRSGKSYVREMRVLYRSGSQAEAQTADTGANNHIEAAGFVMTSQTVESLGKLDTSNLNLQPAHKILMIDRDDVQGDKPIVAKLSQIGANYEQLNLPGYAAMMTEPIDTVLPIEAIAHIIEKVSEDVPMSARAGVIEPNRAEPTLAVSDRYHEIAILRGEGCQAFGILTRPVEPSKSSKTAVLLVSVGNDVHVGPNRMYTLLARDLAEKGISSFRMDVMGIGDSVRGSDPGRIETIHAADIQDDLQDVMTHLSRRFAFEKFAAVGLCSGAYQSFKVSVKDRRVCALVLINQIVFDWNGTDKIDIRVRNRYKATHVYMRDMFKIETMKRVFRGDIDTIGIMKALIKRGYSRSKLEVKKAVSTALGKGRYESQTCREFRALLERNVKALMIYSAEDRGLEVMEAHLGPQATKIRGSAAFSFYLIPGADHIVTQTLIRKQMLSLIKDFLETVCN